MDFENSFNQLDSEEIEHFEKEHNIKLPDY